MKKFKKGKRKSNKIAKQQIFFSLKNTVEYAVTTVNIRKRVAARAIK